MHAIDVRGHLQVSASMLRTALAPTTYVTTAARTTASLARQHIAAVLLIYHSRMANKP